MDPISGITTEQLAEAEQHYKKALELRDSEPETAIELLGQVLEIRNKAHGEKAFECADAYLYYGELLFEQAQANTDYFGEQMKSAAMQRARQIAAGKAAAGDGDSGDDEQEEGDEEAAAEEGDPDMKEAEGAAGEADAAAAGSSKEVATAAAEADQAGQEQQGKGKADAAGDQEGNKSEAAAKAAADGKESEGHQQQQQQQQDAEGKEVDGECEGGEEEEEDEEDEDEDGDDVGSEDAEGEEAKEGAEEGPEVTGETDDMALAWEMLEMARLIYNEHGGAPTHASKLADCHMYIADILCEQEKFEVAVPEYDTALGLLAQVEGGILAHKRRAAELDFKKATALQLADQPAEALTAMRQAKHHLQARINELNGQLAAAAAKKGSAGAAAAASDTAGAAAFAAFASVLSSYTKPAEQQQGAEAGSTAQDDEAAKEAAAVAKQQREVADLRSLIDSINDRIEELTAAVEAHASMKETLRNTFAMVAAGKAAPEGEPAAAGAAADGAGSSAAAGGAAEVIGFSAPTMQAAPVRDMGVIGKGKRVAPVPVAAVAAEGEGSKKRALSDLVSSDQENSNGPAEGEAVAGKPAPVVGQQADAASKKARA